MNHNETTKMKRVPSKGVVAGWIGLWVSLALSGFGLGCDSQADPTYKGDPLLSVSGKVNAALSVGDVQVGLLWLETVGDFDVICTGEATTASGEPSACVAACGEVTCRGLDAWGDCAQSCPDVTNVEVMDRVPENPFFIGGVGQTTPTIGEFPAQFSLDILVPPPDEALIGSATGERLAIGEFAALDPAGAPWHLDLTQLPHYPDWLLGGSERYVLLYAPEAIPDSSIWTLVLGQPLSAGYHLAELSATDDDGAPFVLDADPTQVQLLIAPPDTIQWPLF
jgi:hypothetical protein